MYYGRVARTGRRPGPSTSRGAILEAARRCFAQAGYDGASLRGIAAEAGVDPAVVLHFFGSKHGLFTSAVGWPFDPAVIGSQLAAGGTDGLAARLARVFLGFWEDPRTRGPLLALLRSAMTHEPSARLLREFVERELFAPIASLVTGPDAQLRLELAAGHLVGLAVLRYALAIEPVASASVDELVPLITPSLAPYLEPDSTRSASAS
jgi:AcrR family transcriptional regulator